MADDDFGDPRALWCWALKTHQADVCFETPVAVIAFANGNLWRDMTVCAAHVEYASRSWNQRGGTFKYLGLSHIWTGAAWASTTEPGADAALEAHARAQMARGTVTLPECEHGCRDEVVRKFGPLGRTPDPVAVAAIAQRRRQYQEEHAASGQDRLSVVVRAWLRRLFRR